MALRAQPTALPDAMTGWWPSRYNGFRLADIVEDHGTNRLGIDEEAALAATGLDIRPGDAVFFQCRDTVLPGYHYLGGRLGINAVAHQNGTVRFGTDPAASALDLSCKLHDLDNLYVVDSSFFVSSTAVNPTLTIIANALRVAGHIAGRLGAADRHGARPERVTAHA